MKPLSFSGKLAVATVCTLSFLCILRPAASQEIQDSLSRTTSVAPVSPATHAPTPGTISLAPMTAEETAAQVSSELDKNPSFKTASVVAPPPNYRFLGSMRAGETGKVQTLTLRFAAATRLQSITSAPDFKVEPGGTCVDGNAYPASSTCTLLVRFTAQGPGHRLGKVAIAHSASATPFYASLGGNSTAPAISFTPAQITTVPSTLVSGAGVLSGALNLTVDGGDTLYIADTGNNLIRYLDSSGTLVPASNTSISAPTGIAVDNFGEIYFSETAAGQIWEIYEYGDTFIASGTGSGSCTYSTPCSLSSIQMDQPGQMSIDSSNRLFFVEGTQGAAISTVQPEPPNFATLTDPFGYQESPTIDAFAVDANDNLYTFWAPSEGTPCAIEQQNFYNAVNQTQTYQDVVGGRLCGFSGDGGQARNAEIGNTVGQIDFDLAGNLYFTDSKNQRVRRVDNATGIITTIAGNGSVGYGGDNGPATNATLNSPTGVAVDSQGQVYIISHSATTGTAQVVRKIGIVGALNLGNAAIGTPSSAQTVTLANTGNGDLDFTHVGFSSGNTGDFAIDPNTTSCNFTVPLVSGRSCKIGFTFNPIATGARSTVLTITDDTVTGSNTIQLTGTGYTSATLTPSSLAFASTAVGSSSSSQTATLTNTGKAVMNITSIAFSGTGATSYTDTTTCGTTLAVGASCTIAVTFNPSTTGSLPATLTVADNALTQRQTVALTGTGLAAGKAALSPTSAAFGNQTDSTASAAKTLTLTNSGGASLTISSYTFTGTNATDFTQTHTCGTTLAAAANCTISITFKPAATGARTGTLTIATTGGSVAAALTGTGTAAAAKAALTPASSSFIDQAVATPSAPKTLTLTNSAATPLTITSWNMTGPNATEFAQTHTCGVTLAPAASCSVSLVFTPSAAGTRSATLTAATSSGPIAATISGAAVAVPTATLSSDSLVFPTTNLGSTSASQTLTLTNTGASALVISSITLSGADAASFPHTTTCTSTLAIGASCTITVSFSPIAGGYNRVTLNVTDNTAILHQDVALSGIGSSAAISATLSPSILTFSTPAGSTSPSQTLTLANIGTAVITTSSITVSGTDAALFLKSTTCGLTLPTGANCTITVSFAPTAEANSHATLSVTDNTTIVHQNVALVGSATTPPVFVGPPTITFPGTIVGATSAPQVLQIFSNRGYKIPTPTITFSGANPQSFSSTNTCGATFLPNDQCVFSVSFTPTAVGPQSASLIVTSTDGTSVVQQSVPVSGVGITGTVSAMLTSTVSATSPRA